MSRNKIKKVLIGMFVFLLLFFIAVKLFLDRYLESLMYKRLESLIIKGSDSLYRFQIDDLHISFWNGTVEVQNLHIKVDSARFASFEKAWTLPSLTFELDLSKGLIDGIGIFRLLASKSIKIDKIISKSPVLRLSRHFYGTEREIVKEEPLWKAIRPDIKQILINKLVFDSMQLYYSNADSAQAFKWQFNNCNANFNDIRIDSIGQSDSSRILFTKDVALLFNDVQLKTVDSLYQIKSKRIFYSSSKQHVELDKFIMIPSLSKMDFYKKIRRQRDMFTIHAEKIIFSNFILQRFINNNELTADSVLVQKAEINDYFDRTVADIPENKLGKYPPQLLLNSSITIRIKKIIAENITLVYTERDFENLPAGNISFSNINGTIINIVNHPSDIHLDSECVANLSGKLLGISDVHAMFIFHLNTTDGSFKIRGNIKNVNAAQLNPITIALAKTEVESFRMHEVNFTIDGNEKIAIGNMRMYYNDLRIQLNKETKNGKLRESKFLTRLLNRLTIRNDNPLGKEPERIAKNVKYVRDPYKSFFAIIWRTMFACMEVITMNIKGLNSS